MISRCFHFQHRYQCRRLQSPAVCTNEKRSLQNPADKAVDACVHCRGMPTSEAEQHAKRGESRVCGGRDDGLRISRSAHSIDDDVAMHGLRIEQAPMNFLPDVGDDVMRIIVQLKKITRARLLCRHKRTVDVHEVAGG